jgi:hypothetical protein
MKETTIYDHSMKETTFVFMSKEGWKEESEHFQFWLMGSEFGSSVSETGPKGWVSYEFDWFSIIILLIGFDLIIN